VRGAGALPSRGSLGAPGWSWPLLGGGLCRRLLHLWGRSHLERHSLARRQWHQSVHLQWHQLLPRQCWGRGRAGPGRLLQLCRHCGQCVWHHALPQPLLPYQLYSVHGQAVPGRGWLLWGRGGRLLGRGLWPLLCWGRRLLQHWRPAGRQWRRWLRLCASCHSRAKLCGRQGSRRRCRRSRGRAWPGGAVL
jgi:hypothetical protein